MQTLHCLTSHFCKRKPCYFPTHQLTSFPPTHSENYRFAHRLPGNSLSFHPPTQTHTFSSNDHECKLGLTHAFTHSLYLLRPLEVAPILWVLSALPESVCVQLTVVCFRKIQFSSLFFLLTNFTFFRCKCDIKSATIQHTQVTFLFLKGNFISQLKFINYPAQLI